MTFKASFVALVLAASVGLTASPAIAKSCKPPSNRQNFQAIKITCAKARQILKRYESGEDKTPFGFKCTGFTGEEGNGSLCRRGAKYASWTFA